MQTAIVIPARLESTRFPEKMLHPIGPDDWPLVYWTWRAAMETHLPVFVATDSQRIADALHDLEPGVTVVTTGDAANGTERCAQAMEQIEADYFINWQGDSPTVPARVALALAERGSTFCTPVVPGPVLWTGGTFQRQWQHVGMYGYTRAALERYAAAPPAPMERVERLEQLRFPSIGIQPAIVHVAPFSYAEVNYPNDVRAVEAVLCS